MTAREWKAVVEPPPLFVATIQLEGDLELTEETTSASTIEEATHRLQPGWRVPIKVLKLVPK